MRRKCRLPVLGFLLIRTAAEGAIPLNSLQTFDAVPPVADWATQSAGGAGSSIFSPEALDTALQTNEVAAITNVLRATTSGSSFGLAQWNSTARYVLTRPAGVAYQILLGTIQNTSGGDLSQVAIAYDFGNPTPAPNAEDPGLNGVRAYYSLTGQPSSWLLIPEFSTGQTGSLAAIITLGAWSPGSLLYLLWADDNGSPATDSAFTIDNFIVLDHLPPPPPPQVDPLATNIVCGGTIRLAATVYGFGLSFQWFKDGQLIDPEMNPTATQRVLIITNAEALDAGLYRLIVANAAGAQFLAPVPVQVDCRGDPPNFVFAYNVPDNPTGFRLSVDEPLCTDESVCGSDASLGYNWIIESVVPPHAQLLILSVDVDGTDFEFTTLEPRVPGETYRIRPADDGSGIGAIGDRFGSRMQLRQSITSAPALLFKQGVNGYSGTQDTELRGASPGSPQSGNERIRVDLEVSGAPSQGLLRFENLFGNGPGQIPLGQSIHSATLSLTVADFSFSTVNLHRMRAFWDETTATFDLLNAGVQADGLEAEITVDASFIPDGQSSTSPIELDVTRSVQAWAASGVNHGWVLLPSGTDGFEFYSSESMSPPALSIVFGPHGDPCSFDITQPSGSLAASEGTPFALSVALNVQGLCPLLFQWMKDGVDIPGATNGPGHSVAAASVCDAGVYRLRVSSPSLSITSNPTAVTIAADIVRPALTRAVGSLNGTSITLTFSKVMNATNAPDISHYILDPPLAVTSATLSPDSRSVTLTTAPRTPLTPYTLRIQDLTDNRAACVGSVGNAISPNPTFVPLTGVRIDVPWDSEWLYSTNNHDATLATPTPWYAPDFSPGAGWFAGQALFGTEISVGTVAQFPTPLRTPIPPNTNSPPDQITTYFRKQIDLPPLPPGATYALCHFIDDGAVFYLDGAEIGRVGMIGPPPILFAQHASTAGEASVLCFPFSADPGPHTLAVEVHQGGATTSSDILFGVQIEAVASMPSLAAGTGQPFLTWIADSYWELLTSTNAAGPYTPLAVNPSSPLGSHNALPTKPASFFRLRYKGAAE